MSLEGASISKSREIRASLDSVWSIVSDVDNEDKYWTNLRDVKILKRDGNTVEREAKVGPRAFAQTNRQVITLRPKDSVALTMTSEALDGGRTIRLTKLGEEQTRVDVVWNLELKGVPSFVEGLVKNQISKATDDALSRIAKSAEGSR